MSYLKNLDENQRKLVTALPYRTGLWVSESDDTGGEEADQAEKDALHTIVASFAEDFCKSEFVEELMRQTLAQKDLWPQWQENIENVPQECREVIEILSEKVDHRHLTSFKHNLYDIAIAVAMAFREFDEEGSFFLKMKIYSEYYLKLMRSRLSENYTPPSLDEMLNISSAERAALRDLRDALKIEVNEGLEPEPMPWEKDDNTQSEEAV